MRHSDMKKALESNLLGVPFLPAANIAWSNNKFDPAGKLSWVKASYIPATAKTMGKGQHDSDDARGIFQVSVYVPLNSDNYDNDQIDLIDRIINTFPNSGAVSYNGQVVNLLSHSLSGGRQTDGWFVRDISFNFSSYQGRL